LIGGASSFSEELVPQQEPESGANERERYMNMPKERLVMECRSLRRMLDAAREACSRRTVLIEWVIQRVGPQTTTGEWHDWLNKADTIIHGGK